MKEDLKERSRFFDFLNPQVDTLLSKKQ